MRLVSYAAGSRSDGEPDWRAGIALDGQVVDAAPLGAQPGPPLDSVRRLLALGDRLGDLAAAAASAEPVGALAELTVGPPVPDPDKIVCIGLNYREHAEETALDAPEAPTAFPKFRNSLVGDGAPIVVPAATQQVDYEGELGVVIGRRCRRVDARTALTAIAGVMPLNDVSARDLQFQTPQWTVGKAVDSFCPCGPELVLMDEVADLQDLRVVTRLNGAVVQDARTSQMIFPVGEIIAFLSATMTLEVGDIIATGTPSGVGFTRTPPLFMDAGDEVEVEIEGVGTLRNPVEREG